MLRFACEWCKRLKEPDEKWVLGFAAENLGVTASRREVTILSQWDPDRSVHPFAVHFCSIEHKDKYMAALFERAAPPLGETVVTRRAAPRKLVSRTTRKRAPVSRKRA
jgi:hypothetical protein